VKDPLKIYDEVEAAARDEILKNGGCISHHHGIGKIRKMFSEQTMNSPHHEALRGLKLGLDPKNVFGIANTIDYQFEGFPSTFKSKTSGHW
jgi:alkyldihydroxyacetonephosphate synthase